MAVVSKEVLKVNGVAQGSSVRTWNPKIKPYIKSRSRGLLTFDLNIVLECIEIAYQKVVETVSRGGAKDGKVLFVGTKKNVGKIIKEQATRADVDAHYVCDRWLGGTLTNYKTVFNSVNKLEELEAILLNEDGKLKLSKKDTLSLERKVDKLKKNLSGIKTMKKLPDLIFIVDPVKEINAAKEARRLKIPTIGLVDTYSNPELVDYVIPGNERSINSVQLIISLIADAVAEGRGFEVKKVVEESPKVVDEVDLVETTEELPLEDFEKDQNITLVDYSKMTLVELKVLCKERGIKGYSALKKDEIIALLNK